MPAISAPRLRDAAGSGDWATAGFVNNVLFEKTKPGRLVDSQTVLERAIRTGQAFAALNCSYEGARGLMYATSAPRASAMAGRLARGKRIESLAEDSVLSLIDSQEGLNCSACA